MPATKSKKSAKNGTAAKRIATRTNPNARSAGLWFARLVKLQARLRAPNGCPWDREQTHLTLRTYLIEEAYEVLEALESGDDKKFAEELGDLLLQVVFRAQIATADVLITFTRFQDGLNSDNTFTFDFTMCAVAVEYLPVAAM